jgi:hypothetical protein
METIFPVWGVFQVRDILLGASRQRHRHRHVGLEKQQNYPVTIQRLREIPVSSSNLGLGDIRSKDLVLAGKFLHLKSVVFERHLRGISQERTLQF